MPKKMSYEEASPLIDEALKKRKHSWFLNSISWFDYDDVQQIIRAHVWSKWHLWDPKRPLLPWLNKIISNQIKNILRNCYSNFTRPCLNCPFNEDSAGSSGASPKEYGKGCSLTPSGDQCSECPLYAKWEKRKKAAYDIKMAVTLEADSSQILSLQSQTFDIDVAEQRLHLEMEKALPQRQFEIYSLLFIQNKSESFVAEHLGYKTNEKGRAAGYKQIKNLKKKFKDRAVKIIQSRDICPKE